jgi:uncharacterized protein with HEPN domain
MGEVVDIGKYASARDRKLLGEILQAAQLALAYATYERAFFLSSPDDQRKIAERLAEMARDARKLSQALRDRAGDVPWDALIAAGERAGSGEAQPAELWTAVKKVVPRVASGLAPLGGETAGVFAWAPPPKSKAKRSTSTRARSPGDRSGSPPSGRGGPSSHP